MLGKSLAAYSRNAGLNHVEVSIMFKVKADEIPGLRRLFSWDKPLLISAFGGPGVGEAIVDNRENPSACVLRTGFLSATFFAASDQPFLDEAVAELRKTGDVLLVWEEASLTDVHPPEGSEPIQDSVEFRDRAPTDDAPPDIPGGCEIRPIDEELAKRCPWEGFGDLCNSPQAFFNRSKGFCLMRGDEILCEADAPFWGEGLVELGVVTPEQHRRKGYAFLTCEHLARACEKIGYKTAWSTGRSNLASIAVARKLGFRTECPHSTAFYSRSG